MSSENLPNHGITGLNIGQDHVDSFLDYLKKGEKEPGRIHTQGEKVEEKSIRDADLYYIDEKQVRLYDILNKIAVSANKHFKYDISGIERAQIIHYKAPSNGYNYHIDIGPEGTAALRKISMSLLLNDDYGGGEICFRTTEEEKSVRPKVGEVVAFSSFISHKVNPVYHGERYAVVAWFNGPPFR